MRITLKKVKNFLLFLRENEKIKDFHIEKTPYKWIKLTIETQNNNKIIKEFYDLKETLKWVIAFLF